MTAGTVKEPVMNADAARDCGCSTSGVVRGAGAPAEVRINTCFLDSLTVTSYFGSDEMRASFNDRSLMQSWLDVEAALARAQGSLGLIPSSAGAVITANARIEKLDFPGIAAEAARTSHPLVPLIRALVKVCGEPAGGYVHLGSTTQDVMDTGFVLCSRTGLDAVERQCRELARILRKLSIRYRNTVMAGRTHGQQALPTTFGLRVAGWYDEMLRHLDRIAELRPRLLTGSFGGAAGTMAGYGPKAIELRAAVMRELGLNVPLTSWHSNQDRFGEAISLFGLIASTGEKIARELYFLGRTEIAEAFESQGEGQVGSSTMPHKQNPIRCEAIIGAAATLRAQVPLAQGAMVAQDDRDMGSGMILWKLVPESFILLGGILDRLVAVVGTMGVDTARMRHNLHITGGLIVSEAVMLKLAERIGREHAHHAVSEASRQAIASHRPFADCLREHPALAGRISAADLQGLLDPEHYIGAAAEVVDQTILSREV